MAVPFLHSGGGLFRRKASEEMFLETSRDSGPEFRNLVSGKETLRLRPLSESFCREHSRREKGGGVTAAAPMRSFLPVLFRISQHLSAGKTSPRTTRNGTAKGLLLPVLSGSHVILIKNPFFWIWREPVISYEHQALSVSFQRRLPPNADPLSA